MLLVVARKIVTSQPVNTIETNKSYARCSVPKIGVHLNIIHNTYLSVYGEVTKKMSNAWCGAAAEVCESNFNFTHICKTGSAKVFMNFIHQWFKIAVLRTKPIIPTNYIDTEQHVCFVDGHISIVYINRIQSVFDHMENY